MWYIIIGAVVICALYLYKKKSQTGLFISVSKHVDNNGWEEAKKQKTKSLKKLKKSFTPTQTIEEAIKKAQIAINDFLINHGQSPDDITANFQKIVLSDDLKKKEAVLRKELNKNYKNREKTQSKALALYLAYEHSKLLLNNPNIDWNNFTGLQKLQSNWKAEEYFDALLTLMHAYQATFPNSSATVKLSHDIERTFELWNSRNIAKNTFDENLLAFSKAKSASDKHFIIHDIIEYLERRYKFNPKYQNELAEWCVRDVDLYEQFLIEFHEHQLFSIDDQVKFVDTPELKQKKLLEIPFNKAKRLVDYSVPGLKSYQVLEGIYEKENNVQKLTSLRKMGQFIGYIEYDKSEHKTVLPVEDLDISAFTQTIEVHKSGEKGKQAFLNSLGEACSTEDAFKDHAEQSGWKVMRAEVSFWQAMFCLSFWEEIFDGIRRPVQGQDIPNDLFQGEAFYLNRQQQIDLKMRSIQRQNLKVFINQQIKKAQGSWTRLVYNGDQDLISYTQTPIVQEFLEKIDPEVFAKIVYKIAKNPNKNRSGVFDFVIWNEQELRMVEVKKIHEQVRESQKFWQAWMVQENIPHEIVRLKPI